MKILLNSEGAKGVHYSLFIIKSPDKFTWEEGKEYGDKKLDDDIYRHNLLTQAKAKKLGKKLNAFFKPTRNGPIVKCLRGPTIDPKQFDDEWYCSYRYKAKLGTTEEYLKSMWWNKPGKPKTEKEMKDWFDEREVEEKDEPLF